MNVALLTREYPPEVYGGAGVHVEYLAEALRRHVEVDVHCWGVPREDAASYTAWDAIGDPALRAVAIDVAMADRVTADLVHSHTWYANLAGHLARLRLGAPHVMTTHSLEPLRPWKAEQLGGGYAVSSFCERTAIESADAVIAVSEGMRTDVLHCYPSVDPGRVHVVHNGIDPEAYHPGAARTTPDDPVVLFVGRITRQKGLPVLLEAARSFDPRARLVLAAGTPDTPEIAAEVEAAVAALPRVTWYREHLPRPELAALMAEATVVVCPSVYEPFGIVNLEAMACGTAVVASAVGGIPEIVVDGETGFLVPPGDPVVLAEWVNALVADRDAAARLGEAGRARAMEMFSWAAIAERTAAIYRSLL